MTPKPDVSPEYNPRSYPPVAVAVDVALFTIVSDDLFVLLVERGQDPWKGAWALPGGFVRPDEDLEAGGVTPEMVRLSVGLEDVDDILWDLDQALAAARP